MAEYLIDQATEYSNVNTGDVLFALFKHKWKILFCTIAGLVAAWLVYLFYTPLYESHAKLLVRYVVDRSPIDPVDGAGRTSTNAIGSECEILTSRDLATQVAEALGAKRLLPAMGD